MASSYLEVGSRGLTDLKNDLTNLSKALHELYELMNTDMRQVGEAWRDGKYEEFISGYKPQINKCEEISERYSEWCKRVLDPAIDECIDIETQDVGGDGGGAVGGGASSSGGGESIGGANTGSKTDKFRKAIDFLNNKMNQGPQGSGFDTPQNERPRLSPQQLSKLFKGRQR